MIEQATQISMCLNGDDAMAIKHIMSARHYLQSMIGAIRYAMVTLANAKDRSQESSIANREKRNVTGMLSKAKLEQKNGHKVMKPTSFWFVDLDIKNRDIIQKKYSLAKGVEAVRLAIRTQAVKDGWK